jgi:hypothetical protein
MRRVVFSLTAANVFDNFKARVFLEYCKGRKDQKLTRVRKMRDFLKLSPTALLVLMYWNRRVTFPVDSVSTYTYVVPRSFLAPNISQKEKG